MKRITASFLSLALVVLGAAFTPPATTYKADVSESTVTWKGRKVTGSHEGVVALKSGSLTMDGGVLTGGYFEIDMTSLAVTDLDGKMKGDLEGHLKSDDFFGVGQFPSALFRITAVASRGTAGEYKITGEATIKGKTKEIRFLASVNKEGGTATASITLDRTDYDVRYGSGSFFSNLGDKTIYDEFDLEITLAIQEG